jgi:hypothetical protein
MNRVAVAVPFAVANSSGGGGVVNIINREYRWQRRR